MHCGGPGLGQAAKVCNNMVLAVSQIAVAEAFVLPFWYREFRLAARQTAEPVDRAEVVAAEGDGADVSPADPAVS